MDIFLTIAGLVLGISAFLYIVHAFDAGKRRYQAVTSRETIVQKNSAGVLPNRNAVPPSTPSSSSSRGNAIKVMPDDIKDMISQRTCPMCEHVLQRDEPLYASHVEIGTQKKVLIYGCAYCYKGARK
ncbi:MAG TPA: hypothetical protein VF857_06895 [Spirochaetota bacterium]